VVRGVDALYEIVDGEQEWIAAKAAGLTHVQCELIVADDFEAMAENFGRNQHGTRNPVKLGQMFLRMMALRNLSQRGLARAIHSNDPLVRTYLDYAKAFEVRNSCAPRSAETDIARLSVRQVKEYLRLPRQRRDVWLDAGAVLPPPASTGRIADDIET